MDTKQAIASIITDAKSKNLVRLKETAHALLREKIRTVLARETDAAKKTVFAQK